MKRLLTLAAAIEGATGLALIVAPPIVTQLLLGVVVSGAAIAIGRVAGASLLALGMAAWPGNAGDSVRSCRALLVYNLLIALYLLYLGIRGEWVGSLLWPAAVLHAVLTVFLVRALLAARSPGVA